MSEDASPRAIGIRWFEKVWNGRDVNTIRALMTSSSRGHLESGMEIHGPDAFVEFYEAFLAALPDLKVDILKTLAEGEHVCIHWKMKGTHTGSAFGIEPSGRAIEFSGISWMHVVEGRIREGWDCWNQEGLFSILAGRPLAGRA